MRNLLKNLFKKEDGFIHYNYLTDKDIKKIKKINEEVDTSKLVAFKDLSTMFKTQGIIFTTDYCYCPSYIIKLKGLKSFKHKSGNTYDYDYGYGIKQADVDECTGIYLDKFISYINDSFTHALHLFSSGKVNEAYPYFVLCDYYDILGSYAYIAKCYEYGSGELRNIRKACDMYKEIFTSTSKEELFTMAKDAYKKKAYIPALALYEKADKLKHPSASYEIGELYYNGKGVDINYQEALSWYKEALRHDPRNTLYHYKVALCFKELTEYYKMEDSLEKTTNYYKYITLGELNEFGAPKNRQGHYYVNLKQAQSMYLVAAKEDPKAYFYVARVLKKREEYEECFKYATLSYEHQDRRSISILAELYEKGLGCSKDLQKAFELYSEGEKYYYACLCAYGRFYRDGLYVEKEENKAIEAFTICINGGYTNAYKELAILYKNQGKIKEAKDTLEKGAKLNNIACLLQLAKDSLSQSKALEYYEKALSIDKEMEAKIAFMKYLLDSNTQICAKDMANYVDSLYVYTSLKEYNLLHKQFKDLLHKKCIEEYLEEYEYDTSSDEYRVSIYLYKEPHEFEHENYYFMDVESKEVFKVSYLHTIALKKELNNLDMPLEIGQQVYYYPDERVTKLTINHNNLEFADLYY